MGQALLFTISLLSDPRNRAVRLTGVFWRMCVDDASPAGDVFDL
jgi:hypothetical protein